MTLANHDLPPIPPELAGDEPPIPDDQLEAFAEYAVELTDQGADSLSTVAKGLAQVVLDPDAAAEVLDERVPRWVITDDNAAEWAMRHVARADAELEDLDEKARGWAERISAWFDQRAKPLEATRQFMTAHLEAYTVMVRERSGDKIKTLTLPSGKVTTRAATAPTVAVVDEGALLAWAIENLEDDEQERVIKTTRKVLVSELKDLVSIEPVVEVTLVTLSCGCEVEVDGTVDVGVAVACGLEHGDRVLDELVVVATVVDEIHAFQVVDQAKRVVPGTGVNLPVVKPTVVPHG